MKYHVYHNWKHREGHTVTDTFTKQPIEAENENEAIEKFILQGSPVAKYIKKDEDGDYIYGTVSIFNKWDYNKKNHLVYATPLNN